MRDKNRELPPQTYLQSYLYGAGVRFDYNVIDSTVNRGLNASFYLVLVLTAALLLIPPEALSLSGRALVYEHVAQLLGILYLLSYLGRLAWCWHKKRQLLKDPAPLAVEAHAVVILDVRWYARFLPLNSLKRAVLFKECGTTQPRFFLTGIRPISNINFCPGQVGRVFRERGRSKLYTLDDSSAYQTVSSRRTLFARSLDGVSSLQPKVASPADQRR